MVSQRKARSIENRVLLTARERKEIDRLLGDMEKAAECKITFSDITRALLQIAVEHRKDLCKRVALYEMSRPSLRDESAIYDFASGLAGILEEGICSKKRR